MSTMPSQAEFKSSALLSHEENDIIFSLLGAKCATLATTVVELYSSKGRFGDTWHFRDLGVLCLVKDNNRRSYFFRLFCPVQKKLLWEHEVYSNFNYLALTSYLHIFEAEDCITGFNFADEDEGAQLRSVLLHKMEYKRQRKERKNRMVNNNIIPPRLPESNGYSAPDTPPVTYPKQAVSTPGKREKKKLTKADIGQPQNFRHVSHVGWDPQKGFDLDSIDDPVFKEFFVKAGVSENHLKDQETRDFIYDFIIQHGGREAIKEDIEEKYMPLPTRGRAPPPPPSRAPPATPPPPPPPPPIRTLPPRIVPPSPKPSVVVPPFQATAKPPPPPPVPPLPLAGPPMSMPIPPAMPPSEPAPVEDNRSALMQAIRSGTTLKPVSGLTNDSKKQSDSRGELMDQIRQGVELKSVTTAVNNSVQQEAPENSLAGALARALAERSKVIYSDSSNSSDEEADYDWDD